MKRTVEFLQSEIALNRTGLSHASGARAASYREAIRELEAELRTLAPCNRYAVRPFSGANYQKNQDKCGDLSPCAICGKGVKDRAKAASAVVVDGGSDWGDAASDEADPGYMGSYLIGPDCHRKHLVRLCK